jgi:hypothetical protein
MSLKPRLLAFVSILILCPVLQSWSDIETAKRADKNFDSVFYKQLIDSNDKSVARYLENRSQGNHYFRGLGEEFAILTSSYVVKDSKFYKSKDIVSRLNEIIDELLGLQYPNGTLDSGGNRQSPPDTGFSLHHLCPAAALLNQQKDKDLDEVKAKLEKFLRCAGDGLAKGGIHTPNHRWVVSLALTGCYNLYGDENYLNRVNEWLAEGIYCDSDGLFPERSPNYAEVVDNALLNIGHILNKPYLFDYVKKNLQTTYYLMDENGDIQTVESRRQDQDFLLTITRYYLFYRYMAIYSNDKEFAAIARKIEGFDDFEETILSRSLIFFLNDEILQKKLPEGGELASGFVKEFPQTGLVRIKRDGKSATIFGGNDKPIIVASGRSSNPNFFMLRKGDASLNYVRLSTSFFSMGFFRSDGYKKDGEKYILSEEKEAYYYKPMAPENRDPNGDYKLSPSLDGRFWSKMDFANRPNDALSLNTVITIEEQEDGSFKMDVDVSGNPGVNVTMDFCFGKGGKLEGAVQAKSRYDYWSNRAVDNKDDFFFDSEFVKYTYGNDEIVIGPGVKEHESIRGLEGELYSHTRGSNKGEGLHVYVTGITPFKHTLTIR